MFYDHRDTQSASERETALFASLRELLALAKSQSSGWARRLEAVDPDAIVTRDDLSVLPIIRKSNIAAEQDEEGPFAALVTRAPSTFPRLFLSPGPICEPQLPMKDSWGAARALHTAGLRAGDMLLNTFSYHLTPGGFMFDSGARAIGSAVIPAGPGNIEQQLQVLRRYRPIAYGGTADFLNMLMTAYAQDDRTAFPIRRAVLSGAALPRNLRDRFEAAGISVFEVYGTAELGVVAYETTAHSGFVVNENVIVEMLDPLSGKPVNEGDTGELVVTRLSPDYPLFRFATGDLSAAISGISPCGRTNTRLRGWLGRADQVTKVKGMFVHPAQIAEVINRLDGVGKGRLVVTRRDDRDEMTLEIEAAQEKPDIAFCERILAEVTKLRGNIRVVTPGSIAQSGTIVDQRSV
jgi:phenylacetate-CoA ligase